MSLHPKQIPPVPAETALVLERKLDSHAQQVKKYAKVRYWCEDESRLGLITLGARKITAIGIQPMGIESVVF